MSTMKLYHYAKFHADWPEISVPRKKYKSFLIGDSPVGYLPMLHILGSSHQANVMPHLTHNAATYRFQISAVKIWDFGAHWVNLPRGEDLSGTHIYHHAPLPRYLPGQNFFLAIDISYHTPYGR